MQKSFRPSTSGRIISKPNQTHCGSPLEAQRLSDVINYKLNGGYVVVQTVEGLFGILIEVLLIERMTDKN